MTRRRGVLSLHRKAQRESVADQQLAGELARRRLRAHFEEARALITRLPCECEGIRGPDGRVLSAQSRCARCRWLGAGDLRDVSGGGR